MNTRGELKIADFGLSRILPDKSSLDDGMFQMTKKVCTMWYRGPELLLGGNQYNASLDIWAAGCIFTEFYLRHPLFMTTFEDDDVGQIRQLNTVTQIVGMPTEETWPGTSHLFVWY